MQKKVTFLTAVLMLLVAVTTTQGTMVTKVIVEQTTGVVASLDASEGTLTWQGGASGYIITEDNEVETFSSVTVGGNFTGCSDSSSGGQASASFSAGSFSINLSESGGRFMEISGDVVNYYNEEESGIDTDHLNGVALVSITSASFSGSWTVGTGSLVWDDNNLSALTANVTLPIGTGITDYLSDYNTDNTTITLWANEGLPEPTTLSILVLGGLFFRRRK